MSTSLDKAVAGAGYYPALAAQVLKTTLAGESPVEHFVHAETTFDDREVRRHMTILALTKSRLIRIHIDDGAPADGEGHAAQATSEAALLRTVSSVALTTVVHHPEEYREGDAPSELVLAVGWGVHSRIELEPATCADENCDSDHGYSGGITGDDTLVRVSTLADGEDSVRALTRFVAALQEAVGAAA